MENKATRPRKARRRKPKLPEVSKPETLEVTSIEPKLDPPKNMYAKKDKVGTPKIGRGVQFVETVGLGNLKVITANGRDTDL
jgi:hypothetical protein